MADFDLAYSIDGDASGAVAAVDQVTGANARLETSTAGLAAKFGAVETASGQAGAKMGEAAAQSQALVVAQSNLSAASARLTVAENNLAAAHAKAAAAAGADAAEQTKLAAAIDRASAQQATAAAAVVRAQTNIARAMETTTGVARGQQFAIRNIGQQFGDFGLQVATGQDPIRAFGQQAGQLGFALGQLESGPLKSVGAFLVGPWGIALTVATAVALPFIAKLFDAGSAAEDSQKKLEAATTAADSYGRAQSMLGGVIDLTTGKLKTQNQVLIQTIKLQAQLNLLDAEKRIKDATNAKGTVLKSPGGAAGVQGLPGGDIDKAVAAAARRDQGQRFIDLATRDLGSVLNNNGLAQGDPKAYAAAVGVQLDKTIAQLDRIAVGGKVAGLSLADAKLKFISLANAGTDRAAALDSLAVLNGKPVPDSLKPYARDKKPPKPKKPKSTEARDEFGRDTADKIASIVGQFDGTPPVLRQVNQQVAQLDDLIDDLGRKKPPNFEKLIADAREAKDVVRDGLNKPFNDYVDQQKDSLAVLRLTAQGRYAEAEALKVVQGIEQRVGPITAARKDAVLATVQAVEAEQRAIDVAREKAEKYLDALGGIKSVLEDATQSFVRGDLGQFLKSPGKLLDVFQTLKGQELFDNIFGDTFRKLQDQVNGANPVEDASQRMSDALDLVVDQTKPTVTAFDDVAKAAVGAAGALNGVRAPVGGVEVSSSPGDPYSAAGDAIGAAIARASAGTPTPAASNDNGTDENGDIVVTGQRIKDAAKSFESATDLFNTAGKRIGSKIDALVDPKGEFFGKLGASLGNALEGAAAGSVIGQTFGGKGRSIGGGIGGLAGLLKDGSVLGNTGIGGSISSAAGSISAGLGPLALASQANQAIGKVFGFKGGPLGVFTSLFEGLFKKEKNGSSTIRIADGQAVASAATGKGSSAVKQADVLGGSLADGLNSLVGQLGGQLGSSAAVSIGYRPGHSAPAYRVDPTGKGAVAGGSVQSFETEAEAVAYAIRDAILDGGVAGISAAMQKALRDNTDIDKAIAEALKVKDLEALIGGAGSQTKKLFDDAAAAARDRVTLAKKYGVDLVAVEKYNGEQRTKLVADTLKASVGSLQDLLSSITSGDLFEGSAADKRDAIIAKISDTRARADKGEAGAGDELANLYQSLITTSRDSFGTAGAEYTTDRNTATSGAAAVIKSETDRINAAAGLQADTVAALAQNNTLTSESNDLLAKQTAVIGNLPADIAAALGPLAGSGSVVYNYGRTGRILADA